MSTRHAIHTYNPSYLGSRGRRIEFKASKGKVSRIPFQKNKIRARHDGKHL
jgi:hypothetical protein